MENYVRKAIRENFKEEGGYDGRFKTKVKNLKKDNLKYPLKNYDWTDEEEEEEEEEIKEEETEDAHIWDK